jgi:hypothetical protein
MATGPISFRLSEATPVADFPRTAAKSATPVFEVALMRGYSLKARSLGHLALLWWARGVQDLFQPLQTGFCTTVLGQPAQFPFLGFLTHRDTEPVRPLPKPPFAPPRGKRTPRQFLCAVPFQANECYQAEFCPLLDLCELLKTVLAKTLRHSVQPSRSDNNTIPSTASNAASKRPGVG